MKHRKLRIAWSVGWGIVAVLLVALWMRSFKEFIVGYNGPKLGSVVIGVGCTPGVLSFGVTDSGVNQPWSVRRIDEESYKGLFGSTTLPWSRLWGTFSINGDGLIVPYWFASFFALAMSTIPWIRFSNRFSLRTLLIATTLIAFMLGLIVWATR
jgi:hypothetical protein